MATQLHLKRALAQAALLANWLFGTHLPEPFCALATKEKRSVDLACKAVRVVLLNKNKLRIFERFWLLTSLTYTLRLRGGSLVHTYMSRVWISSHYFSDFPLPDTAFWLYYPLRPFLWAWNQYRKAKNNRKLKSENIHAV